MRSVLSDRYLSIPNRARSLINAARTTAGSRGFGLSLFVPSYSVCLTPFIYMHMEFILPSLFLHKYEYFETLIVIKVSKYFETLKG